MKPQFLRIPKFVHIMFSKRSMTILDSFIWSLYFFKSSSILKRFILEISLKILRFFETISERIIRFFFTSDEHLNVEGFHIWMAVISMLFSVFSYYKLCFMQKWKIFQIHLLELLGWFGETLIQCKIKPSNQFRKIMCIWLVWVHIIFFATNSDQFFSNHPCTTTTIRSTRV